MKKKIVSLALAVCLIAIAAVGTLAYFTDTDKATNTFTVGNVAIKLDEAPVIKNDDNTWTADNNADRVQANTYENVYPGAVLPKDPTVHNTGASDAYVQAEVRVAFRTIASLFANDPQAKPSVDPQSCFEKLVGELGDGWSIVSWDWSSGLYDPTCELVVVLRYAEKVAAEDSTTAIFSNVTIPTFFDGKIYPATFTMDITAEAIQADGFAKAADAFDALNKELTK